MEKDNSRKKLLIVYANDTKDIFMLTKNEVEVFRFNMEMNLKYLEIEREKTITKIFIRNIKKIILYN